MLRRVAVVIAVIVALLLFGLRMTPFALSYYSARTALPITRVVPVDLRDTSVSYAPGATLELGGYEFEVPWNDLDEPQSKFFPNRKPAVGADFRFRSGLRLVVTSIRPNEWVDELAQQAKVSPDKVKAAFGSSDYEILKTIFSFTPDKMNHWNASPREQFLLILKSVAPLKPAESGIFNIRNRDLKGFQEGNPQLRPDEIYVHLFADNGSVELILWQKSYKAASGVTQAEINRMIETVHKTTTSTISQRSSG